MPSPKGCHFIKVTADFKRMHLCVSLTAAGLFLSRRLWRCRTGRLLILLLQSVGSEWIPALDKLCFWWPGCQEHQSGIWNMVRKDGFSGCLEIHCLPFCVLCRHSGKGRSVGANYQILQSNEFQKLSGTPCASLKDSCKATLMGSSFRSCCCSQMMAWIWERPHPSWLHSRT